MKKYVGVLAALVMIWAAFCAAAQETDMPMDWSSVPREQTSHFTFERCEKMVDYQFVELEEICITGYTGDAQVLRIPDTIAGMPVTAIDENFFAENKTLTHVYMPDTLVNLLWFTFEGCKNLEQVHLPAQLTYLPNNLFKDCVNLRHVEMPQALAEIGYGSFEGCAALESIDLPESVQAVSGRAFAGTAISQLDLSRVGVLQGGAIFRDCKNLTSVKLAENQYNFDALYSDIFDGCDKLASIEIVPGLCVVTAEIADAFIDGYDLEDMEHGILSMQDGVLYWNDTQILSLPGAAQ